MPAIASGKVKIRTIKQKQKNGDTYVLERHIVYDTNTKNNKVISSKLVAKIKKGEETPVATRPKRKKTEKVEISGNASDSIGTVVATRNKVGMMDIIDHIGRVSGIDDAIYHNTDIGTGQKG